MFFLLAVVIILYCCFIFNKIPQTKDKDIGKCYRSHFPLLWVSQFFTGALVIGMVILVYYVSNGVKWSIMKTWLK